MKLFNIPKNPSLKTSVIEEIKSQFPTDFMKVWDSYERNGIMTVFDFEFRKMRFKLLDDHCCLHFSLEHEERLVIGTSIHDYPLERTFKDGEYLPYVKRVITEYMAKQWVQIEYLLNQK